MLDEDIKKLLVELNMTHFIDETEKQEQVTASPESSVESVLLEMTLPTDVLDEEMTEEEKELEETQKLQQQVEQVNAQLVPKKSNKKRMGVLLTLLFVTGSSVGYFTWFPSSPEKPLEVVVEKKVVEPLTEAKLETSNEALKIAKDALTKIFDERKVALKTIANEMDALIVLHGEKKQDSFASKLTTLTAKCQAIDEEYSVKIAHEIKELKEKNSAEFAEPFAQLVTSLNW